MELSARAETKLATVSGIDLNTTAKTSLYTVPAGKSCIVTRLIVRGSSINLTTAAFGAGFDPSAGDVVTSATHTELTGSTLYTTLAPKAGAAIGTAGSVLGIACTIAQGAAATATVDVIGYLV